jgi:hypothetical protein
VRDAVEERRGTACEDETTAGSEVPLPVLKVWVWSSHATNMG